MVKELNKMNKIITNGSAKYYIPVRLEINKQDFQAMTSI